jgi:catecholate siderophore receptor
MRWYRCLLASTSVAALLSAGTNLAAAQTSSSTSGPIETPTVSVDAASGAGGYQVTQPSLPKLTEPLRDTPQSIDAVPRQLLNDQGVNTMRDALRNVTGISLAAGEASQQGDNLTLRGFSARSDIYSDGMRDFGSYYRDPFYLEDIQVLKGPSSILFGRGSTGGVVEQDSKQPTLSRFADASFAFGTDATKRATLDVNQPLGGPGSSAAFRINLMAHDSDVAGRDVAENSRFGIAPTLALGMGTPTRLNLSYLHQTEYDVPDYGLPWLYPTSANGNRSIAEPAQVAHNNYYGFTRGNFLRTNVDVATAKLEHDLNDSVTLSDRVRYAHYVRQIRVTEPQLDNLGTNTPALINPGTPLSSLSVTRNEIWARSLETYLVNQSDATMRFATGFLDHTVVAGVEFSRETSNPTRYTTIFTPGLASLTSLTNPNPSDPYNANSFLSSKTQSTAYTAAAYGLDTIKLGEQWQFIAGMRYDRFSASFNQVTYAQNGTVSGVFAAKPVDLMPSYRAAIVYKPASNGSIYFDYGTSFDPSAEQLSLSSSTGSLAPVKNRTFELGSKWDLLHEQLSLRGAIYRTQQFNVREPDPNNPTFNILAGDARVDGIELEAVGHVTEKWQIYAGYAYMFSEIDKSPTQGPGSDIGNRLANVPMHTFNIWTTYVLPWNIEIGGGANYVSSRYANSTPRAVATGGTTVYFLNKVPGYWTFDAMAKYPVTEKLDVQLNIYNITGEFYYDSLHPSHVVPGAGRSALFTVAYKF